jgi:hypothetical protein
MDNIQGNFIQMTLQNLKTEIESHLRNVVLHFIFTRRWIISKKIFIQLTLHHRQEVLDLIYANILLAEVKLIIYKAQTFTQMITVWKCGPKISV